MSTVNSATTVSDPWYSKYAADAGTATGAGKKTNASDKADFLLLMTQQMKNQDPLNPVQGADFLSQLAQFSTVQGIQELQSSMGAVASVMENDQALRAAALVGRDVHIETDKFDHQAGGTIKGEIDVAKTGPVNLEVLDSQGNVVRKMQLDATETGALAFTWDGKSDSGEAVAAGRYSIRAAGISTGDSKAESLPVQLVSRIDSISIGATGLMLNIAGLGNHPLSTIRQIS